MKCGVCVGIVREERDLGAYYCYRCDQVYDLSDQVYDLKRVKSQLSEGPELGLEGRGIQSAETDGTSQTPKTLPYTGVAPWGSGLTGKSSDNFGAREIGTPVLPVSQIKLVGQAQCLHYRESAHFLANCTVSFSKRERR